MQLATLQKAGTLVNSPGNTTLFKKGEHGNEMYIILKGQVSIYANSPDQDHSPLVSMKSGDFFGEMALLDDFPRSTTVVCDQDCLFLVINKNNFEKAIGIDPGFAIKIMQSLSNRLRAQTDRYALLEQDHQHLKFSSANDQKASADQKDITVSPSQAADDVLITAENDPDQAATATADDQKDPIPAESGEQLDVVNGLTIFRQTVGEEQEAPIDHQELLETIFPPGHKLYEIPEPETYRDFVIDKKKECPVCHKESTMALVRNARLNLDKIEEDMRFRYKDFDPVWYAIWHCNHCFYANFSEDFSNKLYGYHESAILDRAKFVRSQVPAGSSAKRTIDQVMNAYYLAIQTMILKKDAVRNLGKLWMRLSWLYQDAGDIDMQEKTALQAFSCYFDDCYKGGATSQKQDQQLNYLLGLFFFRFNNHPSARKQFLQSIVKRGGDQRTNDKAYDWIQDIKNLSQDNS